MPPGTWPLSCQIVTHLAILSSIKNAQMNIDKFLKVLSTTYIVAANTDVKAQCFKGAQTSVLFQVSLLY